MYTLTITSAYQMHDWKRHFNTRRQVKDAAKAYMKTMAFGEVLNIYSPSGMLMTSWTKEVM